MEAFVYDEDIEPIRNDLDILGGSIQDKSNFLINVQDATSIAAYGRRWGKLTAPEILDQADAQRWGNWQLSKLKDPVQKGAVKNVELFQKKIEAEGKARIFDKDGNKIELAIKKVRYRCSSSGIIANLELGELELPVEREIVNLLRDLEKERALAQANVKSLAP